jgi:hypothetical protein
MVACSVFFICIFVMNSQLHFLAIITLPISVIFFTILIDYFRVRNFKTKPTWKELICFYPCIYLIALTAGLLLNSSGANFDIEAIVIGSVILSIISLIVEFVKYKRGQNANKI